MDAPIRVQSGEGERLAAGVAFGSERYILPLYKYIWPGQFSHPTHRNVNTLFFLCVSGRISTLSALMLLGNEEAPWLLSEKEAPWLLGDEERLFVARR